MRYMRVRTWGGMIVGLLALSGMALALGGTVAPAGASEYETVTGTGKSGLKDETAAKDEAVRAAMRDAVEQAAGAFINAQSQTENYQLVHDIVVSRSRGFVRKYDLVEAKRDGGVYKVTIKAEVSTKAVADDWTGMRSMLKQKGMPVFLFAIGETADGQTVDFPSSQTRIENVLLKFGIPMVDKNQIDEVTKKDMAAARLADDVAKIATIGARFKADIIVVGQAEASKARESSAYGMKSFTFSAEVKMRGFRAANARLLFADTAEAQTTGNADSRKTAASNAIQNAAEMMAKKFVIGLMDQWTTELSRGVGQDITLEISGISYAQTAALVKELAANSKLVTHCERKDFSNNVAQILVGCTASAENFADRLSELKSVKLEVSDVKAAAIKAKVVTEEK